MSIGKDDVEASRLRLSIIGNMTLLGPVKMANFEVRRA